MPNALVGAIQNCIFHSISLFDLSSKIEKEKTSKTIQAWLGDRKIADLVTQICEHFGNQ